MSKQIEIIIKKDGSVVVDAQGYKGQSCEAATRAFEEALGTVKASERKPEYNEADEQIRVSQ